MQNSSAVMVAIRLVGWVLVFCFGSGDKVREEKFLKSENESCKVCRRCVSHHVDCLPNNICSCQLPVATGEGEGRVARGTAHP